jgi:hypothetical protein
MITWICVAIINSTGLCGAHASQIIFPQQPKVCKTMLAYKGRKGDMFNSRLADEYESALRRGVLRPSGYHELVDMQYGVKPLRGERSCFNK